MDDFFPCSPLVLSILPNFKFFYLRPRVKLHTNNRTSSEVPERHANTPLGLSPLLSLPADEQVVGVTPGQAFVVTKSSDGADNQCP